MGSNFEMRAVNTIRVLAADMVEKANSGHPGWFLVKHAHFHN